MIQCPHCGYQSEDDEMCRACGALLIDIPDRPFYLGAAIHIAFDEFIARCTREAKKETWHEWRKRMDDMDFASNPKYSTLPGNGIYEMYRRAHED